ncbi:hypothetical protein V6N13_037805 [Hibiscus sabdariffa]
MDGFRVKVFLAEQKSATLEATSAGDGERKASKRDRPSRFASLRDSRSFKGVLLNVALKVMRSSILDKRGMNISGCGLETRKSEVLGSEESFFMTGVSTHEVEVEVVSVHPKPAVALDHKWRISIKKEEMNWFRYSLVGHIKSMHTLEVVKTSLRVDDFDAAVCPWYGLLVVIRVSSLRERTVGNQNGASKSLV